MAIRVCKGKYNISKDDKIDYTFLEVDDNNKFIIVIDKDEKPKYYIYKNKKVYNKFINFEDIYTNGKNILKNLKIDYLPILKDNKITSSEGNILLSYEVILRITFEQENN